MSITIDISDEKLSEAKAVLNIQDTTQLFLSLLEEKLAHHAAARGSLPPDSMTQDEAYRYLASIGGSMPNLEMPTRRRSEL